MGGLLMAAGGIFSGLTIALFELVDVRLYEYLGEYFFLWIIPGVPLAATWLVLANPRLVSLVAPVIARVFTPAALVMLTLYLVVILIRIDTLFADRDFLLTFNLVLLAVMALILFSVSELAGRTSGSVRFGTLVLLGLSIVTLLINLVALSAIVIRIAEGGFTPNRMAVLGANVLLLVHLVRIGISLLEAVRGGSKLDGVERRIAGYLPVYIIWLFVVIFGFPLVFGMG